MQKGLRTLLGCAALMIAGGCSSNDEPYKPVPAWSGKKANVPSPPTLPSDPIKAGDAYTVYGAIHTMNSRIHGAEVGGQKDVAIVGYIVDSNAPRIDKCALHKTGKKDPENCSTEIPTFTLADRKGDDKTPYKIRVMGWASNFANVFEANTKYEPLKEAPKELYKDELWAVDLPYPLPAVGAKVKITGKYGVNFAKSSTGIMSDPRNGIMTYGQIAYLEPSTEPFSLPQLKDGKK